MRSCFLLLVLSSAVLPAAAGAQGARQFDPAAAPSLPRGRYGVGYRLVYVADSSRTALPDTGRAGKRRRDVPAPRVLPVRLWYPTAVGIRAGGAMRYGEYLDVRPDGPGAADATADSLRERTLAILRYAARKYARAGGAAVPEADTAGLVRRLLATATRTVRAARPAAGRFPVVVFAGGAYHSVDENVGLWEHLAGRGYVVASLPSVGVDGVDLPDDDLGLETMTRDVEVVITYLAREPVADRSRLAAAGFSFGGAAALEAAARNRWVGAVVGLDASFIARRHADRVRRAPLFAAGRGAVPVLELHRADTTVDPSVVEALVRAPRYSVELTGLDHVDFNSYSLHLRPLLRRGGGPAYAARDSAASAKAAAYVAMVESVTEFLDAYVAGTGDPDALRASLADDAPRWARVPGGRVRSRFLAAAGSSSRP